jgi:electron transfer flavoprotein beta subunit
MKILVGVKRVVDYAVKVRVTNGTVDLANVKQSMNPFCEVNIQNFGPSMQQATSAWTEFV